MDLTPLAISYLVVSISTFAIATHLYWRNWHTIGHYRLTRAIRAVHFPYAAVMTTIFCYEGIRILLAWPEWFIAAYWVQFLFLSNIVLYSFVFLGGIRLYGQAWLVRQKFGSSPNFGPYLVYGPDPTSSIVVTWEQTKNERGSANPQEFRIGIAPETLRPCMTQIQRHGRLANVTLAGLQPGTTYNYQIPGRGDTYHFQTAPLLDGRTGPTPTFEFTIVGDLHGSGKFVSRTVERIQALGPNVKFILSPGDLTTDARLWQHWRTFWNQLAPIAPNLPVESAPGNHDAELTRGAKHWREIFPYPYPNPASGFFYTFTFLNTAFFILDNYNAGSKQGSTRYVPANDQIVWLEQELANLPPAIVHRVLVIHKAIYTTGDFGCDPDLEAMLLPLITKYRVNLVVSGHSHLFEAFFRPDLNSPRGTAFIVTGGGGGKLDWVSMKYSASPYRWSGPVHEAKTRPFLEGNPQSPYRNDAVVRQYQDFGKLCRHILHVTVTGNSMHVQAIDWDGNQIYARTW
jgi:hypothetical protein